MPQAEKSVFLSYRRTSAASALAVYQNLTHRGFDVFFDYEGIGSGDFEQIIIQNVRARAHFLLILTPSSLERCNEPGDWLRREILEAMECRRNVVPLMFEGSTFETPSIRDKLTGELAPLKQYNGLNVPIDYFDAAMARLCARYLDTPLGAVLHPPSARAIDAAKELQASVAMQGAVDLSELNAEGWFERGYSAADPGEKVRHYTKALELRSRYPAALNNRGLGWEAMGSVDRALSDFSAAIEIDPNDPKPLINRGAMHAKLGQLDLAAADFNQAATRFPGHWSAHHNLASIRLQQLDYAGAVASFDAAIRIDPQNVMSLLDRGVAHFHLGEYSLAILDYSAVLEIDPGHYDAYVNRAGALAASGEFDAAIRDCDQAIRINPRSAKAFNNRGVARKKAGDLPGALEDYKLAAELDAASVEARENLAAVTAAGESFADRMRRWFRS